MSESSEIRMGLVRRGVSHAEFAERCGIGMEVLKASLLGEMSDEVRNGWASLEVEGVTRACVSGKLVRNDTIMFVEFPDGVRGLVRKRRNFLPKVGLPMEVELTDEAGVWRLVGKYRDNGVRLDG